MRRAISRRFVLRSADSRRRCSPVRWRHPRRPGRVRWPTASTRAVTKSRMSLVVDGAVRVDEGLGVADGEHQADVVAIAGLGEVEQVLAEGGLVGLPGGVVDEDAQLVELAGDRRSRDRARFRRRCSDASSRWCSRASAAVVGAADGGEIGGGQFGAVERGVSGAGGEGEEEGEQDRMDSHKDEPLVELIEEASSPLPSPPEEERGKKTEQETASMPHPLTPSPWDGEGE